MIKLLMFIFAFFLGFIAGNICDWYLPGGDDRYGF